jgi:cytochrome c-type biogenesis protein CcsB
MNVFEIENFCANSSFFFLFTSMGAYWIQISFDIRKPNCGQISMIFANGFLFSLLGIRWYESGHFPLSNLYESLMFLAWSISTFHLIFEQIENGSPFFFDFSHLSQKSTHLQTREKRYSFLGALTAPAALFIHAFATFRLPPEMQQASPLVPALQSNWLMMHVTVMILSYSALICGSLLSIAFLIVTSNLQFEEPREPSSDPLTPLTSEKEIVFSSPGNFDAGISTTREASQPQKASANFLKKDFAENLDNLSYRILGIGFPLLTIGILSGAVWANEAWGSYWSWDPKETWAFATWLVFAIYFHTRFTKGWRGKKPAILASVGFLTVWICFLGVNLLGEGLHSYGFFKNSV